MPSPAESVTPAHPPAIASGGSATRLPAELYHHYRFIAVDWSIVPDGERSLAVLAAIDRLLALGARVALLTQRDAAELLRHIAAFFGARRARAGDVRGSEALVRGPDPRRRLFVADGTELHGFDRRGAPVALCSGAAGRADVPLAALFAQVIEPLRIARHDRLVIASELDGGAGACCAPELDEAVRAPAGSARLLEILEVQRDTEHGLDLFAPPRDAAWTIEEPGFDVAREHEIEALLAIANGYLGSRGSIAEGSSVSRPATFIAGAFEPSADVSRVPELVIAPDWGRLRFVVEGEPFSAERCAIVHHRRDLDMRRGVLLRDWMGHTSGGHLMSLQTLHAASLANRHVLLEAVNIAPLNFTGTTRVDAILSGDVRSASGAAHWESFATDADADALILVGRTYGGLETAITSHLRARQADAPCARPGDAAEARERRSGRTAGERSVAERCEIDVRVGQQLALHRTATLHTCRDVPAPRLAGEALQASLAATPFDELLRDHERAWAARWRRADVELDGAPKIERALRFALYHLISTANPDDPRCSIGARALTGEAYRGHVFWDTEIFCVPFYTHCFPEAARTLLMYRHRTLPGARRKAKALGYEGALYAWESADTGDETTPSVVLTPYGEIMRVLSGEMEHHISADVAYAVQAYVRATGDLAFEREAGLEILVETARFWASRAAIEADGRAHVRKVIGPDEYHEDVDDNAFTNWMARRNLRTAAAAVLRHAAQEDALERLALHTDEVARWRDIAERLVLGVDPQTGLIEQFSGYFGLAPFSIADYAVRSAPIDALLGRARTQACQVVKQADVVQLLALLWSEVPAAARRENFLYYEPRTAHGSSLSPGTHALVAARLDLHAYAERYFDQTADIDLGNNMGNAAGGVHIAGMGSLWQAVVFGVAGITRVPLRQVERLLPSALSSLLPGGDALGIEPHLLPGWRHVKVPLQWQGSGLEVHIEASAVEVAVEGPHAVPICALDAGAPVHAAVAEPGRRYVAQRTCDGLREWEEIGT